MAAVASVPEDVQQRTCKEKNVRKVSVDVRPMLGDKEEADNEYKAKERNIETVHREGEDRKRSDKGWR